MTSDAQTAYALAVAFDLVPGPARERAGARLAELVEESGHRIATGFVGETYSGNLVDARGSSIADPLVLAGDEFGTKVLGNTFEGGDQAIRIVAAPTETPGPYGWSHAPALGLVVDGNTLVDSVKGGVLSVQHDASTRIRGQQDGTHGHASTRTVSSCE